MNLNRTVVNQKTTLFSRTNQRSHWQRTQRSLVRTRTPLMPSQKIWIAAPQLQRLHRIQQRRRVRRLQVPKHPRMKRKQRIPPRRQRKCPSQRWMKMQHKVYAFWYLNKNSSAGGWWLLKIKGFDDNFSGWLLDSCICYVFWHLKHWVVILFQNKKEFVWLICVLYWVLINFKDF